MPVGERRGREKWRPLRATATVVATAPAIGLYGPEQRDDASYLVVYDTGAHTIGSSNRAGLFCMPRHAAFQAGVRIQRPCDEVDSRVGPALNHKMVGVTASPAHQIHRT